MVHHAMACHGMPWHGMACHGLPCYAKPNVSGQKHSNKYICCKPSERGQGTGISTTSIVTRLALFMLCVASPWAYSLANALDCLGPMVLGKPPHLVASLVKSDHPPLAKSTLQGIRLQDMAVHDSIDSILQTIYTQRH